MMGEPAGESRYPVPEPLDVDAVIAGLRQLFYAAYQRGDVELALQTAIVLERIHAVGDCHLALFSED